MTRQQILERVKQAVRAVEPSAEIILYGSRARDDATRGSDWDFLVLVDGNLDSLRTDKILDEVYEVELETSEVLCLLVRSRQEWDQFPYRAMPIYERILEEGIPL